MLIKITKLLEPKPRTWQKYSHLTYFHHNAETNSWFLLTTKKKINKNFHYFLKLEQKKKQDLFSAKSNVQALFSIKENNEKKLEI